MLTRRIVLTIACFSWVFFTHLELEVALNGLRELQEIKLVTTALLAEENGFKKMFPK